MNPGTSEMHFVAALDDVPEMRGVLALFEGVATGAADGYARMADRPAAVLLHLGPGLGNGLANLHNARKARTPLVAVVGDHATYHKQYDAQLESDIVDRRPQRLDVGPVVELARAGRGRRGGRRRRGPRAAGSGRHADPSRRRELVRGRGACRHARTPTAATADGRDRLGDRIVAGGRRAGCAAPRWDGVPRARAHGREPDQRCDRGQAPVRDVPGAVAARCRPPGGRSPRLPCRARDEAVGRVAAPGPRRRQVARLVLRLPRPAERPRSRRLRGPRARPTVRRRRSRRSRRWPEPSAPLTMRRCSSRRDDPICRPGR